MSSFYSFTNNPPPPPLLRRKTSPNFPPSTTTAAAVSKSPTQQKLQTNSEEKKHHLLTSIQETQRGLLTTPEKRASIEEALAAVESLTPSLPLNLGQLDGTWRLQYTSAPDVLILLQSASTFPSLFQIGQIFQKFECCSSETSKVVHNVVKWSVPSLVEEQEGGTLVVSAKFSVVSKRNIYLEFEGICVQDLMVSETLQAIIAPAIIPRSFVSMQILQFIRSWRYKVEVGGSRGGVGGLYYLSYLDDDMLLGRAVGGGGVFVFSRAQPLCLSSSH